MMNTDGTIQVIFRVNHDGKWMDYCRETAPIASTRAAHEWAQEQMRALAKRERGHFTYRLEHWG